MKTIFGTQDRALIQKHTQFHVGADVGALCDSENTTAPSALKVALGAVLIGAGDGARTHDHLLGKQELYH